MTKATIDALAILHGKVAEVLTDALDLEDCDGNAISPSPAIIAQATKFLKDNDITCDLNDSEDLQDLERILQEKRGKVIQIPIGG